MKTEQVFARLGRGEVANIRIADLVRDSDDHIWVADVPDLPFCTAHGPTPREAVHAVEAAIEAWIDAARAAGRTVPAPSSRAAHA